MPFLDEGTRHLIKWARRLQTPLNSIIRRVRYKVQLRPRITLAALSASLAAVLLIGSSYILQVPEGKAGPSLPPLGGDRPAGAPRFSFSINGVSRPLGVAVSPNGDRIYVTESDGLRQTKVFDRDGRPMGELVPPDSDPATRVPLYVAVDIIGQVYVSDRRAHAVFVYSPDGAYLGKLKAPPEKDGPWSPMALAADNQGNLLVTDVTTGKHRVLVIGPDGEIIREFGREGAGEGEFKYPNSIASDSSGRILVADSNNGRLSVFTPDGAPLWSMTRTDTGSTMALPRGLAIDRGNRLFVVDTIAHNLLVFQLEDRGAKQLFTLGSNGIEDGQFNFPNSLALSADGHLYVTDRENNRVQVWLVPRGD